MKNLVPKYLVRYFVRSDSRKSISAINKPLIPAHAVFYDDDTLTAGVRNIQGNYTIYKIAEEVYSKSYFDALFLEERNEKERQEFLKLKQKFEVDENNKTN